MYVWFACILKALSVLAGGFVSGILAGAEHHGAPDVQPEPRGGLPRHGDLERRAASNSAFSFHLYVTPISFT